MRSSGILMPIFSLPSNYGIGTLGKEAYNFVDFLKKAGQTYWQVLPIGVTGFGDSPYQSISAFAGNPYFIDLDFLIRDGFLNQEDVNALEFCKDDCKIDYELMYVNRYKILRKCFDVFKKKIPSDFEEFKCFNSFWLEDYALFCTIKDIHSGASFDIWDEAYKKRDCKYIEKIKIEFAEDVLFYQMLQYFFYKQWLNLKNYANENGIKIIGDIPIYVAYDSVDVWSNSNQFKLNSELKPKMVAGVPPDAFSKDGQLWGNPLYDWRVMKNDGYAWWINRIKQCSLLFDVLRIDHFRAFSAYFAIPANEKNAKNGKWIKGPKKEFFKTIENKLGKLNIIAEDLGIIDDEVRNLLKFTGFPGMKILQFAFDETAESSYLPHNIEKNCVVYTGTHDNDTAIGFMEDGPENQVKFMKKYLQISDNDSFNWSLIKSAMATAGDTVILQMQDFLGLDNSARINTPSTSNGNWQWRIGKGCLNDWLASIIYDCTATYFRLPKEQKQ